MTWFSHNALDAELDYIRLNADSVRLINHYFKTESYAIVDSNTLASASIDSSDFSAIETNGWDRRMHFLGKATTASATDTGGILLIALVDEVGEEVLAINDETSNRDIFIGGSLIFPTFILQANQPTQV